MTVAVVLSVAGLVLCLLAAWCTAATVTVVMGPVHLTLRVCMPAVCVAVPGALLMHRTLAMSVVGTVAVQAVATAIARLLPVAAWPLAVALLPQ